MGDRRSRSGDMVTALQAAMKGWQADVWTSCVATVVSWDSDTNTVSVQPALSLERLRADGTTVVERLPVLVNCPVEFPQAGPFALTFPIAAGDEGLVTITSRCIDSWFQSGGHGVAPDKRMHDLSDGVFNPSLRNQGRRLGSISTTDVQLRHEDGDAFVGIAPNKDISAVTPGLFHVDAGNATVRAATINLIGQVNVTGDLNMLSGGQINAITLRVSAAANFYAAIVDMTTGKDIGGTHIHDHGTMTSSGHTGTVV